MGCDRHCTCDDADWSANRWTEVPKRYPWRRAHDLRGLSKTLWAARVLQRRTSLLPVAVFVVVCLLTALLAWSASNADVSTNHRLLDLQVRQAASVLSAALPGLETPLTAAFDVAMVTHDPKEFRSVIAPDVGAVGPFVSASLWQVAPGPPKALIVVGASPDLTAARATALFSRVRAGGALKVTRFSRRYRAPSGLRGNPRGRWNFGGGVRRKSIAAA